MKQKKKIGKREEILNLEIKLATEVKKIVYAIVTFQLLSLVKELIPLFL